MRLAKNQIKEAPLNRLRILLKINYSHTTNLNINKPDLRFAKSNEEGVLNTLNEAPAKINLCIVFTSALYFHFTYSCHLFIYNLHISNVDFLLTHSVLKEVTIFSLSQQLCFTVGSLHQELNSAEEELVIPPVIQFLNSCD